MGGVVRINVHVARIVGGWSRTRAVYSREYEYVHSTGREPDRKWLQRAIDEGRIICAGTYVVTSPAAGMAKTSVWTVVGSSTLSRAGEELRCGRRLRVSK